MDNLDGLSGRQKLRLRWYGDGTTDVHGLLELKQRQNLLGRKLRGPLSGKLDLTLPWAEVLASIRANAGPDWDAVLQTAVQPTLINHYKREYYATPDDVIRATLDFDQIAYGQRISLRPNLWARLVIPDTVLIEVKAARGQARRLHDVVARFPPTRTRNSKYVLGLLAALG
jgi:hypothetical protein